MMIDDTPNIPSIESKSPKKKQKAIKPGINKINNFPKRHGHRTTDMTQYGHEDTAKL